MKGTSDVSIYQGKYNDTTKIYFVDTPGFDDTHRSDSSILREIADWLSQAYGNDFKLTGIVYLHRIMDVRLGGSAMKNLRMFKKLCGENELQSVVLATTWWSSVDKVTGEQREQQIRTRDDFWAGMIAKGSKMFRQDRDAQSAREIVDYLVQKKKPVVLKVQEEMVDENKTLDETSAGIEVDTELAEQKKHLEAELRRVQEEMNATVGSVLSTTLAVSPPTEVPVLDADAVISEAHSAITSYLVSRGRRQEELSFFTTMTPHIVIDTDLGDGREVTGTVEDHKTQWEVVSEIGQ